jgi:hypothetical protein
LSILTKICPNVPWVILFQSYSLVSYLFIKQDQLILTCNSAVASLMLSRFFILLIVHVATGWGFSPGILVSSTNTTLCDKVCQLLATDWGFSPGILVL